MRMRYLRQGSRWELCPICRRSRRARRTLMRSDLFSLGAVLYEMATGKQAFRGESVAAVLEAILGRDPVSVSRINPDVPLELEQIINRCLEKDRSVRFQSA